MSTKPSLKIAQELASAQVLIGNSLAEGDILTRVKALGYTAERLAAGQSLLSQAEAAVQAAAVARGNQRVATADSNTAYRAARAAYLELAQVARAIFPRGSGELTALGLDKALSLRLGEFISNAYIAFDNATNSDGLAAALHEYGLTANRLATGRGVIEAFDQAQQALARAIGDKQQATQDQAAALAQLRRWTSQYKRIARVALAESPTLLAKIGIVVRTTKTAAQIAAPQKAAATRKARREAKAQLTMTND